MQKVDIFGPEGGKAIRARNAGMPANARSDNVMDAAMVAA
jgi:hypothetical protein